MNVPAMFVFSERGHYWRSSIRVTWRNFFPTWGQAGPPWRTSDLSTIFLSPLPRREAAGDYSLSRATLIKSFPEANMICQTTTGGSDSGHATEARHKIWCCVPSDQFQSTANFHSTQAIWYPKISGSEMITVIKILPRFPRGTTKEAWQHFH